MDQNYHFNCQNKTLHNNHISGHDSEVINVKWAKYRYLPSTGSVPMSENLQIAWEIIRSQDEVIPVPMIMQLIKNMLMMII